MKTNSILLATLVFVGTLFSLSTTHAAAVVPLSSGVKQQAYSLEWCSPHHIGGTACRTGSFHNILGVPTVEYNGANYTIGNVTAEGSGGILRTTRTSQSGATTPTVSFFDAATGQTFALEGEGVLTIRIYITDYADNTSFYKMVYKIDKTAPDLAFTPASITKGSVGAYYEGTVTRNAFVTKNDSVDDSSNINATTSPSYSNPVLANYIGDTPVARSTVHNRKDLPAYYFRNDDFTTFILHTTSNDNYNNFLDPALVSGVSSNYALMPGTSTTPSAYGSGTTFTHSNLSNVLENKQSTYRLRLYDNTVDSSGNPGNYSETAFYVVRDNTAPNMIAGGNTTDAIEKLLKFGDNTTTVWDKTTPGYNPEVAGAVSKFIAASGSQLLYSSLSDVGIAGGSSTLDYNLYNVGLDRASTTLKIDIEQSSAIGSYDQKFTYPNRWTNDRSTTKDFSNVDLARANGYRKYATQMSDMCDLVGNCLKPKLQFRVVAAGLDKTTSNLSINPNTTTSGKVIANGSDSYKLSYTLNDVYNNKIVPVVSQENTGTPQIKTVDTTVNFTNGLNIDQRSNTASGAKLITIIDSELPNNSLSTLSINNPGNNADTAHMQERNNANTNGTFTLEIKSSVPTKGMYPYLSSGSVLSVASILNTASGSAPLGSAYPPIGYFNDTTTPAGPTNIITYNTGTIGQSPNNIAFNFVLADYGNVTGGSGNFASLGTTHKAFLEFASPVVYGMDNMMLGSLTNVTPVAHTKNLFNIDPGISPKLYEKILVAYNDNKGFTTSGNDGQPGIIDFSIRKAGSSGSGTLINPGACYPGPCANMFLNGGTPVIYPFPITGSTPVEVIMSPITALMPYIDSNIHKGYVSALTYSIGTDTIQLPSVARDILDRANPGTLLSQYDMTRKYFDNNYELQYTDLIVQDQARTFNDIAITGLSNRYNGITTGTGGTKANVNIGKELTRMDLVTTIKKNVAILSAGFGPKTHASGKRWCNGSTTPFTIDQPFINNTSHDCTQVINGETISFIDGNATIDCGGSTNCSVTSGKRSIIVKNGSLYLKSNITTLNASRAQTAGQLFLGVMNDAGLSNITVDATNPNILDSNKKGWLFVDPRITNIDAFLFAQGPMVSYSSESQYNVFYTKYASGSKSDIHLRNQLHIMGSLLTLNKIGEKTAKCPFIIENCSEEIAPIFDLVSFRNFKFASLSMYDNNPLNNGIMSPWFPTTTIHGDGQGKALSSGGLGEAREPEGSGTITCGSTVGENVNVGKPDLRCITDRDYRGYPMLIERDLRWNSNRSEFFRMQN